MTENFKYGSNNYHKKLSTADKASVVVGGNSNVSIIGTGVDEGSCNRKPRLKKSFSECEYYEMDIGGGVTNFNLSPSRRKCRGAEESHRFHHCPRQTTSINDGTSNNGMGVSDISFIDVAKAQYNYDTSKSQYLLAQQQKLKEYKNDPNYLTTNGDNYSSESSTETRGILKKTMATSLAATTMTTTTTTSDSNNTNINSKSLLKRNKGLSTLSLCSCDADTEVIPRQSRPLYQYSLDRKRPLHTYTCEQNAQILLRLERERLKKYGSYGRLHFTSLSNSEQQQQQQKSKQTNNCRNDNGSLKDFSATTNTRTAGYPETNHIENEVYVDDVTNHVNNNIDDDDIIPPNFPPPPKTILLQRSSSISNKHTAAAAAAAVANPVINQNEFASTTAASVSRANGNFNTATNNTLSSNKPDLFNFATNNNSNGMMDDRMPPLLPLSTVKTNNLLGEINANNCQSSKLAYPLFFCDDQNRQMYNAGTVGGGGVGAGIDEKNSVYFYHHEPPTYLPNYDNISTKFPDKYSTMPPPGNECSTNVFPLQHFNLPISKVHASTCNLNNQFNSSNLISSHNFSNSLNNFNMMDTQIQNYYNFNPSFTQLPSSRTTGGAAPFGSSSIMGSSFASNISLNGTPKNPNMPWKHRQCSSRSSSSGTNSSKWDLPSRQWLALTSILLIAGAASVAVPLALSVTAGSPFDERYQAAIQLLDAVPLIDGHNDLPWNIRKFMHNQINDFRFDDDLKTVSPWANSPWSHTDLQRLKRGRLSAQFWAAYVPCEAQYKDAVQITLEQIDVIERLADRYSPILTKCTSAYDIKEAHKNRRICSLIGVEGGHSLGGSLGVLRTFYSLGVRYMTLTSTCHTPWADSSNADAPKYDVKHGGLTAYGKIIVREMNRLGMIVDLSKASVKTMKDVLAIAEAPIIFSHSSAYELCNSSRNVQDEILQLVTKNRGLVMVNFYNKFLSCSENATVHDVVAHINHIKNIAGIDCIGLGSGFDGINYTPKGIEDVSAYPYLFAELMGHGWTVEELTKLAGANLLRVMSEVERIRDMKRINNEKPYEDVPNFRLPLQTSDEMFNCSNNSL